MEPPRKAPKLSLTEAADIVNQQHSNLGTVHETSSGDSQGAQDANADHDFSQEEEEENTQIQASLPLYFDHLFGTCIGHSQSQIHSSFHQAGRGGPISSQSSSSSLPITPFPLQCSFGFSLTHTRILDSQGFIFNSSTPSKSPISAPPPTVTSSSSSMTSSPTHDQQTALACQPSISDPAQNAATIFKLSSSSQSPAAVIFSSPSSTSSSPGTGPGSGCSGTPVLFPSPSSPAHSHSPTVKAIQKFSNTQQNRRESLAISADTFVCPSKVSPHCQQQDVRDGIFLSQSIRKHLTCTQGSHSHQSTTCRKRRLDFEAVAQCPARGNRANYICPPSCTPLSDCTQIHSRVSIFAVVLQGKDNLILPRRFIENLMISSV